LPGIVILNYDAAKLGKEVNSLPNLQESDSVLRRLIEQLKSLKTTSAQDQAALFENQLRDTKKIEQYTKAKTDLTKKLQETQLKLLQSLKSLFQKSGDNTQPRPSVVVKNIRNELEALRLEVTVQKQNAVPEQQKLERMQSQVYISLPPAQQANFEPPKPR